MTKIRMNGSKPTKPPVALPPPWRKAKERRFVCMFIGYVFGTSSGRFRPRGLRSEILGEDQSCPRASPLRKESLNSLKVPSVIACLIIPIMSR